MSKNNGDEPINITPDQFSRNITSKVAQQEHKLLRSQKKIRDEHEAERWQDCTSCKRRMKRMRVWVDGKPVT